YVGPVGTVSYDYDPLGRRTKKTVNGLVTQYLYDEDQVIGEYDAQGNVLVRYVYAAGGNIDEPLVYVDEGASPRVISYYHGDARGSVVALSDENGLNAES